MPSLTFLSNRQSLLIQVWKRCTISNTNTTCIKFYQPLMGYLLFCKSKKHSKGWTAFQWTLVAFLGSPRMSLNGPVNDTHLTSPSPKLPPSNMICRLLNLITFMRDITIMTNCQLINLELAIYKWVINVQFPWSPIIRYWSLSPKINTEKRNKCARLNDFHCYTSVREPVKNVLADFVR